MNSVARTGPSSAYFEMRWLAAVGMLAFLIACAFGSFIIILAGAMMWGGFTMVAPRFLVCHAGPMACGRCTGEAYARRSSRPVTQ